MLITHDVPVDLFLMPDGDPSAFTKVMYGCAADEVSEIVLMTPIDEFFKSFKERSQVLKEMTGFNRGFNADVDGTRVTVLDSRIGSPLASDCTYYLRFTPCKKVIFTGLIGALQPYIRVGDIVVPIAAVRGEGASKYFVEDEYPAVADFGLTRALASTLEEVFAGSDIKFYYGPIYTTDSFAAETLEFLEHWKSKNLLGIEMETSTIYTLATLLGIQATSVHIVSDNPVTAKTFFHTLPDEDRKRRETCADLLLESLYKLVTRI
jgi:uridine phosphorylase